jgi:hypothetical protein
MTLRAPADARPGDRFVVDVVQGNRDQILGGSTYVLSIFALDESHHENSDDERRA